MFRRTIRRCTRVDTRASSRRLVLRKTLHRLALDLVEEGRWWTSAGSRRGKVSRKWRIFILPEK